MSDTLTLDQFVDMVADELGIGVPGQALSSEDYEKISTRIPGIFGELVARGVCSLDDIETIDGEKCGALAVICAFELAAAYSGKKDFQSRDDAESRLRVIEKLMVPPNRLLEIDPMLKSPSAFTYAQWLRGG